VSLFPNAGNRELDLIHALVTLRSLRNKERSRVSYRHTYRPLGCRQSPFAHAADWRLDSSQRIKREHGQDERGASSGSTWDQYELREYEVDPTDLSAETVAAKIGLPPEQVFKTLAVQGDRNRIYLAVVPGNEELDSKALAHHTGDRKVDMVPLKDVQDATGYIRGGVTALACKRDYQVYAGVYRRVCRNLRRNFSVRRMRGLQISLAPEDYIRAVNAQVAAIAKAKLNPVRLMNSTVAATRRACAWNVTPRGGQILELKLTMPAIESGAEERGTQN